MTRAGIVDRVRAVPVAVWAAVALFLVLRATYATVIPSFESPDEYAHLDLVEDVAEGHAYPAYDAKPISAFAARAFMAYSCSSKSSGERCRLGTGGLQADDAPDRGKRPTAEDLDTELDTKGQNQLAQHPPLYYEVMGTVLRTQRALTGPLHVDQDLGFLRLLNVALLTPLPVLIWLTARRTGASDAASRAAAFVPLAIPQLLAITAALNNDNLFTLLAVATGLGAVHIATGDLRVRTGLAVGVLCGLAMFTKGFGIVLPPTLAVAYLVGWHHCRPTDGDRSWSGPTARRAAIALAAAGATVFACGGWWYAVNLARYGVLAPSIEDAPVPAVPGFSPDRAFFVRRFVAWIIERFWGWFGAYDLRISQLLIVAASAVLLLGLAGAFWPHRHRRRPEPLVLGVALLPVVLLLALVAQHAWSRYTARATTQFIQGRYLFAAIGGIAVITAVGLERMAGSARRFLPMLVLAWAAVMNLDAIDRILANYWGPVSAPFPDRLGALIAWSPWPGWLLGLGTAVGIAVAGAAATVTVRSTRTARSIDPGSD